ncbi:hypothetical protein VSQ82_13615 [Pseudomonas sp. MS-1(2024)]|uniref:hypothetical protein n=1 Tax=Pseudomonas sp. MS-1(2024) TaxID=3112251 RepID=UPI002DB914B9|nr:hypothetical protein [Pseudomonas sp. MS-1(2024)]MEC4168267.1 hypothetical protein [Pseudomonas sp. MS-1(2024)]
MDLFFERVPAPRVFEWNIYHHGVMSRSCLDIDGVLCFSPTSEQNDDGPQYIDFLLNARPLNIPSAKVHSLVTNRLEKYRKETEIWLKRYNIEYDNLIMRNVASKEERQRINSYTMHKADYYQTSDLDFLIESEVAQASSIGQLTGKPVFYVDNTTPPTVAIALLFFAAAIVPSAFLQRDQAFFRIANGGLTSEIVSTSATVLLYYCPTGLSLCTPSLPKPRLVL